MSADSRVLPQSGLALRVSRLHGPGAELGRSSASDVSTGSSLNTSVELDKHS